MPEDLQFELPWRLRTRSYELVLTVSDERPALTLETKEEMESAWIDIWANWLSESIVVEIQHLNSTTIHLEFESFHEAEHAAQQAAWLLKLEDDEERMTAVGRWAFDENALDSIEWQPLTAYEDEPVVQETDGERDHESSTDRDVQDRLNELEAAVRQELEDVTEDTDSGSPEVRDAERSAEDDVDDDPVTEGLGESEPADPPLETIGTTEQTVEVPHSAGDTASSPDESRNQADEAKGVAPDQTTNRLTVPDETSLPTRAGNNNVVVHIHCSVKAADETQTLLQKTGQRVEELPAEGGFRFLTDPVDRQTARSLLVLLTSRYGVTTDWAEAEG